MLQCEVWKFVLEKAHAFDNIKCKICFRGGVFMQENIEETIDAKKKSKNIIQMDISMKKFQKRSLGW